MMSSHAMKKSAEGARETKTCGQCGRTQEEGEKFLVCGRCKVLAYCSKACQKQHWRGGHKDICQAPSEREDTVKKAANKTVDDGDKPSNSSAEKAANKTVDEDPEKPAKTSAKKKAKPSSTSSGGGAAAAEKEQNQKPSSRRVTARVDATGAPLSFGKDDNCAICPMRWLLKAKAHGRDVSQYVAWVMEERKRQHVQSHETRIHGPAPGAEVEVTGLVNRPELNGVSGVVVRYIPGKDQWEVKLNGGHGKASLLKAANLRGF